MAIVVGYVPTKEGRAALTRAAEECKLRGTSLVVVNSARGGRDMVDPEQRDGLDNLASDLKADGVEVEVRSPVRGLEPAAELTSRECRGRRSRMKSPINQDLRLTGIVVPVRVEPYC